MNKNTKDRLPNHKKKKKKKRSNYRSNPGFKISKSNEINKPEPLRIFSDSHIKTQKLKMKKNREKEQLATARNPHPPNHSLPNPSDYPGKKETRVSLKPRRICTQKSELNPKEPNPNANPTFQRKSQSDNGVRFLFFFFIFF